MPPQCANARGGRAVRPRVNLESTLPHPYRSLEL